MSGPKTSEYTLTAEQRQNLNAQNACDRGILVCINRIKTLQDQVSIALDGVQIYDDCGNDESVDLTNNLKNRIQEIKALDEVLSESFASLSEYERPMIIILTDEELCRKKAILEKLNSIKSENTKLLKEIEKCGSESKQLKERISSDIQENLENAFNLSWDSPDVPETFSMQEKIMSVLNSLLANTSLPAILKEKVQSAIKKAENINSEEFLKNLSAVIVKPLADKCTEYIRNLEMYGEEFKELEEEYKVLCADMHIPTKTFEISESSISTLKFEIAKLEKELLDSREQEYIADTIDEAMKDMGYTLIGNREVTKKSGKRFRDELYTFREGIAVNIRYDSQGKIAMELGGIDTTDRLPSEAEATKLENEMVTFCNKFTEFERRLAEKGVVCKNRISHLPAKAEYAQIINTSDYEIKEEVETIKVERRFARGEGKKQYRNE